MIDKHVFGAMLLILDGSLSVASDNIAGNYFESTKYFGNSVHIGTDEDNNGAGTSEKISYAFNSSQLSAFNSYYNSGKVGFGLDPDCHYNISEITLVYETAPVPEPSTIILLCFGLIGFAGLIKRKS